MKSIKGAGLTLTRKPIEVWDAELCALAVAVAEDRKQQRELHCACECHDSI